MEIEIVTTKRRLTKSLLNQMRRASIVVLKNGYPLGFIINGVKDIHKAILMRWEENYYIIPANYQKGEVSIYRNFKRWTETIGFKSPDACDEWWHIYQQAINNADNQIYI